MSNQIWNNLRVGTRVLLRKARVTVLLFVAAGVIPILSSLAMLVLLGAAIVYRAVAPGRESAKRDSEVGHKC